jgi:hypothetical protein
MLNRNKHNIILYPYYSMAKKKSKKLKTPKKPKTKRSKKPKRSKRNIIPTTTVQPQRREDPFKLFMYHVVRLPWYFVKFWDWLFTLITALLVYLTK